jgi:peroxiredoxin Q/BCP
VRDALPDLEKRGVAVAGISPDPPDAQKAFDEQFGLGYPLLSDTDHWIAEEYGVWGELEFDGKSVPGIVRSAFLIDENGAIAAAWYGITPQDTVPELMKALGVEAQS